MHVFLQLVYSQGSLKRMTNVKGGVAKKRLSTTGVKTSIISFYFHGILSLGG